MYKFVCQRQITDSVIVLMTIEIIAITTEGFTQSMRIVEHGGHTIKSETIEMELLQPIFAVRKQEVKHIILSVVKTEGIPCWMFVTISRIEELIWITGKIAQSFNLILHSMRVHNIHNHGYSVLVSLVNKSLQLLWGSKTT